MCTALCELRNEQEVERVAGEGGSGTRSRGGGLGGVRDVLGGHRDTSAHDDAREQESEPWSTLRVGVSGYDALTHVDRYR